MTLRARLDAAATDADLAPPQGEVRFVVNGEVAGSAPLAADGTATLTLPGLPTGVHTLTATFSGGAIWGDCEAPPVSLFVGVNPPAAAPEGSELFLPVVQR